MIFFALLILLFLALNVVWQDSIGMMHPVIWVGEILALFVGYHFVRAWERIWEARKLAEIEAGKKP